MALQPITNRKRGANPTSSSSQEMLEKAEEMEKAEESDN